jgi:capsular exopolysaccharide synthesis family protein
MSHIFDALRRSQTERGGTATTRAAEATELLERAERETSSKWESAVSVASPESTEFSDPNSHFRLRHQTATATLDDPGPASKPSQADELSEKKLSRANELSENLSELDSLEVSAPVESRLVTLTTKADPSAEAFRLLAVRLRDMRRQRDLKKVLITSSTPEEGKSLVAANVACALATGTRERILILDGDLRHPTQSRLFGLGEMPGLWEWLRGESGISACIHHLAGPNLWILPSNNSSGNPLDLMQSKRVPALMEQLTTRFDWIVIDSPPAMPLADASIWSQMADGILMVARTGISKKKQLQRAVDSLDKDKVIGALLNCPRNVHTEDYHYYLRSAEQTTQ